MGEYTMTFSEATIEDLPELMECLASLSPSPYKTEYEVAAVKRAFKERLLNPAFITFVGKIPYEIDNGIKINMLVATASIIFNRRLPRNGGLVTHIEDVAVHKNFQRRGYGEDIVSFCAKYSIAMGSYKIILNCEEGNVKFYENCGFTKSNQVEMKLKVSS